MASQLCSEINGGSCKNKVSARNGYVCAAGHSDGSTANIARPTIPISNMGQQDKEDLVTSTEDKSLQLELFRTKERYVQEWLAENPSIDDDLQWKLFRSKELRVLISLAMNPSVVPDLQWELFNTGDETVMLVLARWKSTIEEIQLALLRNEVEKVTGYLAENCFLAREAAAELAKKSITPSGYTRNKPLAELIQPESLALLGQYPGPLGRAYLTRLLYSPREDKEESKALTLHSYLVYEKSGGIHVGHYKNEILNRYVGDQEVELILSTEPAQ